MVIATAKPSVDVTWSDPNGSGMPEWPRIKDLATSKVMVFGDTPQAEAAVPAAKLAFYQAAYQRLLKSPVSN